MTTSKEKQFWLEFFDLYRSKPELWKIKSGHYKNRTKKKLAYSALIRKCQEVQPLADKNFVARKLNSFRSIYRRELKKVKRSLNSGTNVKYVPTLWYFNCLSFLKDQIESVDEECTDLDSENEHIEDESLKTVELPKTAKKEKSTVNSDELLELAAKRLRRSDDYSQTLANVWANEFRLASDEQKMFAKKAIDDILFEARLGTLHRNSVKINNNSEIFNTYDSTLESSRITSSPTRCTPNQTVYPEYIVHLPSQPKPTYLTTDPIKNETYNGSYSESNEQITVEPEISLH